MIGRIMMASTTRGGEDRRAEAARSVLKIGIQPK